MHLSEENSLLTAAEADWLMREKLLDTRIHELERQLDNLQTVVCITTTTTTTTIITTTTTITC